MIPQRIYLKNLLEDKTIDYGALRFKCDKTQTKGTVSYDSTGVFYMDNMKEGERSSKVGLYQGRY